MVELEYNVAEAGWYEDGQEPKLAEEFATSRKMYQSHAHTYCDVARLSQAFSLFPHVDKLSLISNGILQVPELYHLLSAVFRMVHYSHGNLIQDFGITRKTYARRQEA